MKRPDPLLESLAEEAADLPTLAAEAARQRSTQRKLHRQLSGVVAAVAVLVFATWKFLPSRGGNQSTVAEHPVMPNKPLQITSDPQALPSGLDEEQTAFVLAAKDLPLLLVRNAAGKVTRIHVVER